MIFYMVGNIIKLEALMLILPLIVSVFYNEINCINAFSASIVAATVIGFLLTIIFDPKDNKVIYAREGFIIVTLAWIFLSVIGALPFVITQEIPNFFDAVFETVSGFTTTGASILSDVESMSRGLLFWRSFTHWLGGMGVLVLIMAIIPTDSGRAIHILRAEMAGPVVGKIVPKIKDTAKILYIIYLSLTILEMIFLLFGGMTLFESAVHALGTAGTGGFGIKGDSIASYNPYLQWVITVFMLIFGINFNLFYLLIIRKFKLVFTNRELWVYGGIVLGSAAVIAVSIYPLYNNISDSVRHSFFQVASIVSTTGYSSADFDLWPDLARNMIFILFFFGGCAGSTAGGLKISRIMILFKSIVKDIRRLLHPRSVASVKLEGKPLDNGVLYGVTTYFALYIVMIAVTFLMLSFELNFDFEANLTASVSCCNNVGPGLGLVGPMAGYGGYSNFSKLILTFAMLLGRLEIYPVLLAFYPKTWTKK